jgi:hypothetical protein
MVDMTDQTSAGASPWERDLYAHLSSHAQAERGLLEDYSAIAEKTESKAFRYLVNLLIEDEIRHHRLFAELAESLKTEALTLGEEPTVPYLDFERSDPVAVRAATKTLTESEERDARELKHLHRELREVKDTSLWSILVDLMERDTEKHLAVLRFVREHTPASR